MGKKVIVDPTDAPEELTAEQLSATSPVHYRNAYTMHDALRARIRAAGISNRCSGIQSEPFSRESVRQSGDGATRADDCEIEAALERLGA